MTRIDPHAHTLHSDGTDTPRELIVAARQAGLDIVGISDHDTLSGWDEAGEAVVELGVGLIRGVEVSAQWQGRPVHILSLLMNQADPDFLAALKETRDSRGARLLRMTQNLEADFPNLVWEDVLNRADGAPLGRPHLADQLVELGYFADRTAAFEWVLHPEGPYYERQVAMDPVTAVLLVRRAGGVPILAHPQANRRGRPVPQEVVAEMAEAGLFGLERDHRDQSNEDRQEVERLATLFDLKMTGGSDYHGTGKPNRLGENLLDPFILAQVEEQATTEVIRS